MHTKFLAGTLLLIAWMGAALPALAEASATADAGAPAEAGPQPGTPAEAAPPSAGLEEILVTARKREETLISVPVVVTAVSASQLEQRGVTNLDGIARMVPQLLIGNQSGSVQGGNIAIRGIAGPDSNPFGDQAVSFNIDGVQVAKAFVRRMTQTDLSQVEVLKGPQALFFGKNSPAGIVSIRTADPTKTFEAKATVGYETRADEYRTEDYVSGPITDTLGFRIAGDFSSMAGDLNEATPSTSLFAVDHGHNPHGKDYSIRGTLKWEPLDNFNARFKLNYSRTQNGGPASTADFISCPAGARQTGSGLPCGAGNYSVNASSGSVVGTIPGTLNFFGDGQNFQDQKQYLGSLELNYQPFEQLSLTSVTGLYHVTLLQCQNYENDDAIILPSCNSPTSDREFSQELRANTDFKGMFNFAGGLYYSSTTATSGSLTYLFGAQPLGLLGPGTGGPDTPILLNNYYLEQDGKAYSTYLQIIFKLLDVLEVDVGGRYSYEKKELPAVYDGGGLQETLTAGSCFKPGVPCTTILDASTLVANLTGAHKSWNDFSPEATISYRPSQTLTIFGSYKHGFLSGGFNSSSVNFLTSSDGISYNPEVIKGEEIGVKAELFDGALAVNGAAYMYKITGLQLTNFQNSTSTIRNAGAAKIRGLEGDFNYRTPLNGLGLHGAAAYNHGIYDTFQSAPCYNGQTPSQGCVNGSQDLSGTELIRAPKWNLNGGATYEVGVSSTLRSSLSIDAAYTSSYLTDDSSAPQSREGGYTLIDSTLRLFSDDETWELAFIGRNLSNKHYWVASPNVPFTPITGNATGTPQGVLGDRFAAVSRGREYLFQASYKFKAK